ncbi:hypothetical protein [Metapseudomonas otitidis]|uniref:hypothetical protein n=1 Tax=Metapseudomonas otitidis TaxID=319939 RepID=UPI0011136E3D|nr:hypothetical protein [Pseudomonas otitidis]
MSVDLSKWREIIDAASKPLSLVALMLLVIMSLFLFKKDSGYGVVQYALLAVCVLGVLFVAVYEMASRKSASAREVAALAETLGECVARASHAHISNLEIPQERVEAYARLAAFVKGRSGVTNAEFRSVVSEAIVFYAYTQGGCSKAAIDAYMDELNS